MSTQPISTQELDAIARLGLDDVRECFSSTPTPGAKDRAELCLKTIRLATGRMGAETNQIATAFRIAKAVGAEKSEMAPLWKRIAGASGATAADDGQALAVQQNQPDAVKSAPGKQHGKGR